MTLGSVGDGYRATLRLCRATPLPTSVGAQDRVRACGIPRSSRALAAQPSPIGYGQSVEVAPLPGRTVVLRARSIVAHFVRNLFKKLRAAAPHAPPPPAPLLVGGGRPAPHRRATRAAASRAAVLASGSRVDGTGRAWRALRGSAATCPTPARPSGSFATPTLFARTVGGFHVSSRFGYMSPPPPVAAPRLPSLASLIGTARRWPSACQPRPSLAGVVRRSGAEPIQKLRAEAGQIPTLPVSR